MVHSDMLSPMLGLEVSIAGITELLRAGSAAVCSRKGGNVREPVSLFAYAI